MNKFLLSIFLNIIFYFSAGLSALGQNRKNPNKLQLCSKDLRSKPIANEKHERLHECWGKYAAIKNSKYKNSIYEGEFVNGKFDGFGTYYFRDGSRGDWYVGNFREGRIEGIMINRNFYSENYFDFPHTAIKLLRRLGVSETFFHGI
jgi:hypothetical protein